MHGLVRFRLTVLFFTSRQTVFGYPSERNGFRAEKRLFFFSCRASARERIRTVSTQIMESERGAEWMCTKMRKKYRTPVASCEVFIYFFAMRLQNHFFFFAYVINMPLFMLTQGLVVSVHVSNRRAMHVHTMKSSEMCNNP